MKIPKLHIYFTLTKYIITLSHLTNGFSINTRKPGVNSSGEPTSYQIEHNITSKRNDLCAMPCGLGTHISTATKWGLISPPMEKEI
jgi:hypothetical protein